MPTIREQIKALEAQFTGEDAHDEALYNQIVELQKVQYKELVPMVEIGEREQVTYFALAIGDELDKIKKRCEEWFHDYFYGTVLPKSPILIGNLNMDLEYMFSRGLWLLNLANQLGLGNDHDNEYFAKMFVRYDEEGYKSVVSYYVDVYNQEEDRPFTPDEIHDRNERSSKLGVELIEKLLAEEKK